MTADRIEAAKTAVLAASKSASASLAGDEQRHGEAYTRKRPCRRQLRPGIFPRFDGDLESYRKRGSQHDAERLADQL
jgi:hypothetical protein